MLTEAEGDTPHHITVQIKGRIYALDILDAEGQIVHPLELQRSLEQIEAMSEEAGQGPSVGALTGMKRTDFYKVMNRREKGTFDFYMFLKVIIYHNRSNISP